MIYPNLFFPLIWRLYRKHVGRDTPANIAETIHNKQQTELPFPGTQITTYVRCFPM